MVKDDIRKILREQVNPLLAGHNGGTELVKLEKNIAYVKMNGACSSCPSAQYTVEDVIKSVVLEAIPELDDIVLDTSVSEDLLDTARKILNGELR